MKTLNQAAIKTLRFYIIDQRMSKAKTFTRMVYLDGYNNIEVKSWLDNNYEKLAK